MAQDSASNADGLEALAHRRFGKLSEAEKRVLRSAAEGELAVCGPSLNNEDPANDLAKADDWGLDRQVRSKLVRCLCTDQRALKEGRMPPV